jgi:hypothetical protein
MTWPRSSTRLIISANNFPAISRASRGSDGALWLTGLQHAPSAMLEGVNLARVIAPAMSLALTGVLMILFRVFH